MAGWFYVESGGAVGPLSRIELEAAVQAGRVTPDTLVCEDGQSEWRLARRIPGLVSPKAMKAWQASVTASRRIVAPPPAPRSQPSPGPAPPGGPRAYAAPSVSVAEPVRADGSGLRRHAGLVVLVGLAASAGGILGAMLVLRLARQAAPPAADAGAPNAAAAPAVPRAADASLPHGLRPDIPPPPPPLPGAAQSILDARLASMRDGVADYESAAAAFVAAGGLDASTLSSREAIASRLEALEDLRTRNESLRRALSTLPDQVRGGVTDSGQPDDVADAAARRAKAELAQAVRDREADAEMQDLAGEALGIFEQAFGSWSVRQPGSLLQFSADADPDAAQRYARILEDSAAVAKR